MNDERRRDEELENGRVATVTEELPPEGAHELAAQQVADRQKPQHTPQHLSRKLGRVWIPPSAWRLQHNASPGAEGKRTRKKESPRALVGRS